MIGSFETVKVGVWLFLFVESRWSIGGPFGVNGDWTNQHIARVGDIG